MIITDQQLKSLVDAVANSSSLKEKLCLTDDSEEVKQAMALAGFPGGKLSLQSLDEVDKYQTEFRDQEIETMSGSVAWSWSMNSEFCSVLGSCSNRWKCAYQAWVE